MKKKTKNLTHAALIAALYVVLTYAANMFGLASGAVQIRISEALTVLPYFTPAAIPGLFVGCVTANLLTGSTALDIVFGSLATLLGALGTYALRKKSKYLAPIPPIAANTIIIPCVLIYAGIPGAWWYLALTVGAGEVISCGVLGIILINALRKRADTIF
ncbi:MAG: QueT transporter family protein [Clostridia bacterium]|nr:QueT transporter family protein [Clostridia bacterium]